MTTITAEFQSNSGTLSANERLKQHDRQVMNLDDFTEADLQALQNTEPPPEAADFDHEMSARDNQKPARH